MANKVRCIQLGNIAVGKSWDNPQSGRIYSVDGIAPTLNTCGGGTVPCIITETEAETWLKESLLQAEGETQAIHQTEPQAHQRNNG